MNEVTLKRNLSTLLLRITSWSSTVLKYAKFGAQAVQLAYKTVPSYDGNVCFHHYVNHILNGEKKKEKERRFMLL